MEHYNWSNEKNEKLKAERGVSFEQIVLGIAAGDLKAVYKNPNKAKYPKQSILVVQINQYCYLVPYVDEENDNFLITIIPSRNATKKYMGGNNEEG